MTTDLFYLIGFPILILIIWTIPFFREIFKQFRPELFAFASGYFFLLCDIKNNDHTKVFAELTWEDLNPFLIVVAIALGLTGIALNVIHKKEQKQLKELESDNESYKNKFLEIQREYFKVCSDTIRFTFKDFFSNSDGNGRVSIYKHHEDKFILLGRYSTNPLYNKRGREFYLDNEGFISKGWELIECEVFDAPKWTGNGRDYKSFMKNNCNISDETLKKIHMKSCSFYVKRIENEDARNPLGLIVFEKLSNLRIDKMLVNNVLKLNKAQIETLIKSMKTIH